MSDPLDALSARLQAVGGPALAPVGEHSYHLVMQWPLTSAVIGQLYREENTHIGSVIFDARIQDANHLIGSPMEALHFVITARRRYSDEKVAVQRFLNELIATAIHRQGLEK